jgi:hypothetical protein
LILKDFLAGEAIWESRAGRADVKEIDRRGPTSAPTAQGNRALTPQKTRRVEQLARILPM